MEETCIEFYAYISSTVVLHSLAINDAKVALNSRQAFIYNWKIAKQMPPRGPNEKDFKKSWIVKNFIEIIENKIETNDNGEKSESKKTKENTSETKKSYFAEEDES